MNIVKTRMFEPAGHNKSAGSDKTEQSPLAAALSRASELENGRLEVTETIPMATGLNGFDSALAESVGQDLNGAPDPAPAKRETKSSKDKAGMASIDETQQVSPRVLELQRKQSTAEQMRLQLQDGTELLADLMRSSDTLVAYLATAEQQLAQLEAVEKQSLRTQTMTDEMLAKYKKLSSKSKEQQKQLEILELTKTRNRQSIDSAKAEIERLKQNVKVLQHDLGTKDMAVLKLEDDIAKLREMHEAVQAENKERSKKLSVQDTRIEELMRQTSAQKAEMAHALEANKTLGKEKEQATVGFNDMLVRYKSLNDKHADLKSQLDERQFEIDSKTNAFEDAISIRDARIHQLEVELIEAKKQLIAAGGSPEEHQLRGQDAASADDRDYVSEPSSKADDNEPPVTVTPPTLKLPTLS